MNNSSAKKQNRILLVMLVVVLTAAAILIALTGTANKKDSKNENPPLDTKITETSLESEKIATKKAETDKTSSSENAVSKKDEKKAKIENEVKHNEKADSSKESKESDEAKKSSSDASNESVEEVSAVQSGVLPRFSAPLDALVLKNYSADIPVFSYTMNDYRTHNGVDFACSVGTPVSAAADGIICEVTNDPMMGVTVGISHSGGAVTRYKGLSEESMSVVSVGDNVSRGQIIGASGDTALIESAEESHLHFELEVNGEYEDPGEFMKLTYLSDMVED